MRLRRFRLKSLTLLVFLSALVLAAVAQFGRMDQVDFQKLKRVSILFVPFLILIVLKLVLVLSLRARRTAEDQSSGSNSHE